MVCDATSPQAKTRFWSRAAGLASSAVMVLALGIAQDAGAPSPATAAAPARPAPPANGELGFVIVKFQLPVFNNDLKIDCPDGMIGVLKDQYLRTLPAAEAARLQESKNLPELDAKWKAYGQGPNGANLCGHINEFLDRPPTPQMKGPIAWGLDLDGDVDGRGTDDYTCKHEQFTTPTGEKGIDFQRWRVFGCNDQTRGVDNKEGEKFGKGTTPNHMTGEYTQVLLLRGVDSLVNDPDVSIVYANTDDRPVADPEGKPIYHASFSVSKAPRKATYRNELKGRVVNGVLTTTPKRFVLYGGVQAGMYTTFDLDRGRLQLKFQPDGSIKGLIGGYAPLLNDLIIPRAGSNGTVVVAGIDCAGQYASTRMMADGDKDPKTGKCRKISYAYEMIAVPAFVNDPIGDSKRIALRR